MKLNYSNIMLVRAYKNFIPQLGKMNPSCFEKYLDYDFVSDYLYIACEVFSNKYQELNENIKELLPLTSLYNSTLSFSINGLAPDDMSHNFSEYNVCIIEPLKYHLDEDFITFNVTETTIKGGIHLSNEAILIIKRDYFESLSEKEKLNLKEQYHINLFDNNLKESVKDILISNNCPVLDLVNKSDIKYVENSNIKESSLEFIDNFAENNNISKLRLFNLYTTKNLKKKEDINAKVKINDELKYYYEIKMYYRNMFYEYLLLNASLYGLKIEDGDKYYLFSEYSNSKDVLKKIVTFLVEKLGYNKYRDLISNYNLEINNNYKTNKEIVENNKKNKL